MVGGKESSIMPLEVGAETGQAQEIRRLKDECGAVILAHYYQPPEIKEIADFVGDSLRLAQQAATIDASVIVFCGVFFMAESAKILSPEKTVLLPEVSAGCYLADQATGEGVRVRKEQIPGCVVVTYVNSSAAVKAESDIVCTSANAVKIVDSLPEDKPILFVPDRNLGHYVAQQTGRQFHLWDGCCNVHDKLTAADISAARDAHPGALVMVHPECRPEVIDIADHVSSTGGMLRFAKESQNKSFIVGTEEGMIHSLEQACPDKLFYPAAEHMTCPDMKVTTLEKVEKALLQMEPQIEVDPVVAEKARLALKRMLEIS
jgi:quinolinate synthase